MMMIFKCSIYLSFIALRRACQCRGLRLLNAKVNTVDCNGWQGWKQSVASGVNDVDIITAVLRRSFMYLNQH
jgi:hypothetical protein